MPQPVRVRCHAEVTGLAHRPEHAKRMGNIIGISGRLESYLGWILAFLSRGSATITIPMFHAVVSTDAQRAMLLAAANQALAGPELDSFQDLMDDFRPRYGERSKLVHNAWGHSNDHPDHALWWKAADLGSGIAKWAAAQTADGLQKIAVEEDISLKAMLYSVKDLDDVALRLDEYTYRVSQFMSGLWTAHPAVAAATTAATDAQPISDQSQMDLPQPPQTGTEEGR